MANKLYSINSVSKSFTGGKKKKKTVCRCVFSSIGHVCHNPDEYPQGVTESPITLQKSAIADVVKTVDPIPSTNAMNRHDTNSFIKTSSTITKANKCYY